MSYTVKQLSEMTGVSVRTLHYYDEIGLLTPERHEENGYRLYGEETVLRLQQILFFKELDFPLKEVKVLIDSPHFDMIDALQTHKSLLQSKVERMHRLLETIDNTIKNVKGELIMAEKDFFNGFSDEEQQKYREEAKQKYGAEAVEATEKRVKGWSKDQHHQVQETFDRILNTIRDNMAQGFDSAVVQEQVKDLHGWMGNFYECSLERFLGLGDLYKDDERFATMYKTKYHEEMPEFLFQAIEHYCANAGA
ncbi:MAG: MerR family transcriptional regulator [Tumebacillaceae bacterium]